MWLAIAQPSSCENRIKASWRTLKTKRIRLLPQAGQDLTKPPGGLLRCIQARAGTTISGLFRSFCDASLAFFIRSHYREAAPPNDQGIRQLHSPQSGFDAARYRSGLRIPSSPAESTANA